MAVVFGSGGVAGDMAAMFAVGIITAISLISMFFVIRQARMATQREREATERANKMLETSPMLIEVWDEKFNIIDCNRRLLDIFGLADKDSYFKHVEDYMPETQPCGTPSKQKAVEVVQKVFDEGSVRFEWLYQMLNGEMFPVEVTCERMTHGGKPIAVMYIHDMRPLMAATEKEREANEMSQIFLNASPFIMNIWDDSISLVSTSEQAAHMFELENQKQYIENFSKLSPEFQPNGRRSSEYAAELVQQAFNSDKRVQFEWLHQKLNGEPVPTEITLMRFMMRGSYFVAAYTSDLRPIKAAMEQAVVAEKRAKLLLDASPVACYLLDANRDAIDCNQVAMELFVKEQGKPFINPYADKGVRESCFMGCKHCRHRGRSACFVRSYLIDNFHQVFPDYVNEKGQTEGSVAEYYDLALETGVRKFEYSCQTLYGEMFPCEVVIVPVIYDEAYGFAVYIRDLREAKRVMAETQARLLAEEENRAKTRFLARMSHEIRTPMNAVLGITEMQLRKGGHSPETEEAFSRIYSSSSLLLTIINDILDLSKVEAGKMEILAVVYEISSLIIDTAQLNLMHIGVKPITFELNVDEKLPAYLVGDELRIKQILNNLLSNAFKYTDAGKVELSFTVGRGLAPAEQTAADEIDLVITVKDTGQGMTEEQLGKLFDIEFTRFNIENNRAIEGSGLGMTITYALVQMMRGEITAESTPGHGSVFTVRLPQKVKGRHLLGAEAAAELEDLDVIQRSLKKMSEFNHALMPYGRVLVVDDVESNLHVVKGVLLPYKIAVETAESGQQAVDKIKAGQVYDIIFMDHMMPQMDGVEATKIIRSMGYTHPVIALTANALKEAVDLFMTSGFSGFISKPIDVAQLDSYLVRFIRDKHEGKENGNG